MIGRFIIECDPEHFDVAMQAAVFLQRHPEQATVLSTSHGPNGDIKMFAKRLEKSISIRQVWP